MHYRCISTLLSQLRTLVVHTNTLTLACVCFFLFSIHPCLGCILFALTIPSYISMQHILLVVVVMFFFSLWIGVSKQQSLALCLYAMQSSKSILLLLRLCMHVFCYSVWCISVDAPLFACALRSACS